MKKQTYSSNNPLTRWCLHVNNSIQPIVPIRSRCAVPMQRFVCPPKFVSSKILWGTKDPYQRLFQETDDERITSDPPFRNVPEIFDSIRSSSLSRHDDGICARIIRSTDPSLRQLLIEIPTNPTTEWEIFSLWQSLGVEMLTWKAFILLSSLLVYIFPSWSPAIWPYVYFILGLGARSTQASPVSLSKYFWSPVRSTTQIRRFCLSLAFSLSLGTQWL